MSPDYDRVAGVLIAIRRRDFRNVKTEERAMLTIGYCRVSTEEQAAEGFSIEGQPRS